MKKGNKLVSIKLNFVLNALRVFSTALITIFTMPYLNRVLGAESIGKVEYVYSILYYFIMFSALGIPVYGIREVSRCRENPQKLYKLVWELMIILFFTTIISYIILFGVVIRIPFLLPYKNIIYIMSSMIFLNNVSAEWYFQGIENQKFITFRNIIVKLIVFGLFFFLIKKESDYELYAFLFLMLWFGANIIGFVFICNKLLKNKFSFKELDLKRHFKPILTVFIITVSASVYIEMPKFFIGSFAGDQYLGYYVTANSLVRSMVIFISVIGSVMLPRLSYLFENDKIQYEVYLKRTFMFMMLLALPCTVYFFVFSDNIILLMGGAKFLAAGLTLKILSPLCIIISFAYFFGLLVLYPQGLERIYTWATIFSAIFSIFSYFLLIKYFQQNGAAAIVVLSELFAVLYMGYYISKHKIVNSYFEKTFVKIIFVNIFLLVIFYFLKDLFILHNVVKWFACSVMFCIAYITLLLILKEETILNIYSQICQKLGFVRGK